MGTEEKNNIHKDKSTSAASAPPINIPLYAWKVLAVLSLVATMVMYAETMLIPAIPDLIWFSRSITNLHVVGSPSSSSHLYFAPPSPSPLLSNGSNKVIMIGFDDSYKSQILYAKPILDKYGFKASFFEVCTWIGKTKERQTWQDIAALERDGMDIESHTMTHAHLPKLLSSPWKLDYEIGGSKQCLANHGINATIFGYPLNLGSDNLKIVNVVAKYYNLARSGSAPLMFLNCIGYPKKTCRLIVEPIQIVAN